MANNLDRFTTPAEFARLSQVGAMSGPIYATLLDRLTLRQLDDLLSSLNSGEFVDETDATLKKLYHFLTMLGLQKLAELRIEGRV